MTSLRAIVIPAVTAFALLSTAAVAVAAEPAPRPVHLFILSGQSNMERLDPDVSFTPTVRKGLTDQEVIVVKDAAGGQPIRRWYKQWHPPGKPQEVAPGQGDLYDRLLAKVQTGIANQPKPASVTFVWMQGERDAKDGTSAVYAESLKGIIAQLAKDLKRDDINVVIGRLSDARDYAEWKKIREIQVAVSQEVPHGAWVDTDDLNGERNGIHCTRDGYEQLGTRFAQQALVLIRGETSPTQEHPKR